MIPDEEVGTRKIEKMRLIFSILLQQYLVLSRDTLIIMVLETP